MSNASSEPAPPLSRLPWSPWWGLVVAIVIYYGAQFIGGLVVSLYPLIRHYSSAQAQNWLNNSVTAQFIFILIAEGLTLLALIYFLKRYKLGLAAIGLKKPRWVDPLYGLAALPLYLVLYLLSVGVISHLVPSLNVNQQQQIGFNNVHGALPLILTFISLVVLPPIVEEIMVRGFIYTNMKKAMRLIPAAVLTSAIFASAHLPEGGAAGPLYIAALDTFVLSLVLIYLREKTGSLWASITLHAIKNGIAFTALFLVHAR